MGLLRLLAVFALGLHHGLDLDHVASVDALAYQGRSRWVGAQFALGPGGAVTLVAVLVSLLAARGQVPPALSQVGFVFGLAFDTASQAAAWGSAAAAGGGLLHALAVGAVFTAGMALTDTVDGQLMGALAANGRTAYRRTLGWFTVVLAFAVAASVVAEHVAPGFAPNGAAVGAGLVALLAGAWAMGRAPAPGSGTRASG